MSPEGLSISGIRVIDIMEEGAESIEKMVNSAIKEINERNIKILDIQITGNNLILVMGDKKS